MTTRDDATCNSYLLRRRRTSDALGIIHDVLIREEWFAERPPLALAFTHPLARLYCEMWRAMCPVDLEVCATTAGFHYTGAADADRDKKKNSSELDSELPFFVSVGRAYVRNPAVLRDPPVQGAADITRPTFTSAAAVLADSPFASATLPNVCSLVPPLTSVATLGVVPPQRENTFMLHRMPRTVPVVNPSAPLYALETYTETIFKLPIGLKLGHTRTITTYLSTCEYDASTSCNGGSKEVQLVRGFFSHVPAAVSLSASHRAAAAISAVDSALRQQTLLEREEEKVVLTSNSPLAEPDDEGHSLLSKSQKIRCACAATARAATATGAREMSDKNSDAVASAVKDDDDDWETSALLEEAQLEHTSLSTTQRHTPNTVLKSNETRREAPTQARSGNPVNHGAAASATPANSMVDVTQQQQQQHHSLLAKLHEVQYAVQLSSTFSVLNAAAAVLPPPSDWWLRRPVMNTVASPSQPVHIPLYAHCVTATKQWVDWLDGLQRPLKASAYGDKATSSFHDAVALRGVSLAGWSSAYVPQTLNSLPDVPQRVSGGVVAPCRLETSLPRTLPLRGLHLESTVSALNTLLSTDTRHASAAWCNSLVALDLPYLRGTEVEGSTAVEKDVDGSPSPAPALDALRQLRFCSLNRGNVAWKGYETNAATKETVAFVRDVHSTLHDKEEGMQELEELILVGVTSVTGHALSTTSRRCSFLRVVDLSNTAIAESELEALVFGTWDNAEPPASADRRGTSLLVWLEEVRLAACHAITRLRPLAALPRLRKLNVQASGVCRLEDLDGCNALEEVVLTRCASVRQLHPLWRLPRLRCVEADSVGAAHIAGSLLPLQSTSSSSTTSTALAYRSPFASNGATNITGTTAAIVEYFGETCFAAPLCRLNLSQSTFVHGTAIARLAAALHDVSGCLQSLTVLVLDRTRITDATIEALAGLAVTADHDSGSGGGRKNCMATSLCEFSVAGCLGVHHLGPLGRLPQLRRLIADGAAVESVEGLQHSRTLAFLSVSHCSRLWSIAALAYMAPLRVLDVSCTPLNDAGLLRFVFPDLVRDVIARELHGAVTSNTSSDGVLDMTGLNTTSFHRRERDGGEPLARARRIITPAVVVPSQIEELRLYQCSALRYIGCVAHLPRLRRLDASSTTVFDRGFVGFFATAHVLLRTQLWASSIPTAVTTAAEPAVSWTEEEEGRGAVRRGADLAMAPVPDEVALLHAWREWQNDNNRRDKDGQERIGGDLHGPLMSSSTGTRALPNASSTAGVGGVTAAVMKTQAGRDAGKLEMNNASEFVFCGGVGTSLTHVSFAYCAEVRGIAPCALFSSLASLDMTGTAVDSAVLLTFVNLLHECCRVDDNYDREDEDEFSATVTLEMEKGGLRPCVRHDVARSTSKLCSIHQQRRPYTLTSLTLSYCHYVTDVRCCATIPSLLHLTLCGTPIDNSSIEALAASPALAAVSADSCSTSTKSTGRLSTAEVRWWRRHQCALRSLDVRYCHRVTDVSALLQTPGFCENDALTSSSSALQELLVSHSGVTASKEELRALNTYGRCVITT